MNGPGYDAYRLRCCSCRDMRTSVAGGRELGRDVDLLSVAQHPPRDPVDIALVPNIPRHSKLGAGEVELAAAKAGNACRIHGDRRR